LAKRLARHKAIPEKNAVGFTPRVLGNCLLVQGGQSIMSTQKTFGYPHLFLGFASTLALGGATGCASSGGLVGHAVINSAIVGGSVGVQEGDASPATGVRAGQARVVDSHVNPTIPVRLTANGDVVEVRFAHSRAGGALAHLDRTSLAPVSPESFLPVERPAAHGAETARVALSDGRFIVCWKAGDFERGYRMMAQAWTGGGEPIGTPVPISPVDTDVLGAPELVSVDGDHAVAAFAAMTGDRAEVLAVSLQVL
jgi:hypothetical protein